jgi:hypothetical protein
MGWQTILIWIAIIAVPVALIVFGTLWQLRVSRWASRASRIDEERFAPEVKGRIARLRRLLGVKPPPKANANGSRNQ